MGRYKTDESERKTNHGADCQLVVSASVVAMVLLSAPLAQAQSYPAYSQPSPQYPQYAPQPQYQQPHQTQYVVHQRSRGLMLDDSPFSIRCAIGYAVGLNGARSGIPLELALAIRLSTPSGSGPRFFLAPEIGWSIVFENDESAEDVVGHYNTVYDNFGTLGTRIGFKLEFVEAYLLTAVMAGYGYDDNFIFGVRTGIGVALFNGMLGVELSHLYRGRPETKENLHNMRFLATFDLITTFYDLFR